RIYLFFFQAEDGIRDKLVTGVQTCALPISRCSASRSNRRRTDLGIALAQSAADAIIAIPIELGGAPWRTYPVSSPIPAASRAGRSEERRVGKECGARWGAARGEESARWALR